MTEKKLVKNEFKKVDSFDNVNMELSEEQLDEVTAGFASTFYYREAVDEEGNAGYQVQRIGRIRGGKEGTVFVYKDDWNKYKKDHESCWYDPSSYGNTFVHGFPTKTGK